MHAISLIVFHILQNKKYASKYLFFEHRLNQIDLNPRLVYILLL